MNVSVLSPERLVYEAEDAELVFLPGEAGDMGIMPDHMPLLSSLRVGVCEVRSAERVECIALAGGFAEVTPEAVKVIADAAELPHEIDQARARLARSRAEDRIRQAQREPGDIDVGRARAALLRAINRLHVAEGEGRSGT